jgi:hypothetical protein
MRVALAAAAACVLASTAAAALPKQGELVAGRSLAGVRLGQTERQVRAVLGGAYGVCRGCARPTWYYNLQPFDSHGLGVEFTRGRVSAVYTIMEPPGWIGPKNVVLGVNSGEVSASAGPLVVVTCPGYDAWVADGKHARTVYYILNDILWGFGLMRPHADPCR